MSQGSLELTEMPEVLKLGQELLQESATKGKIMKDIPERVCRPRKTRG